MTNNTGNSGESSSEALSEQRKASLAFRRWWERAFAGRDAAKQLGADSVPSSSTATAQADEGTAPPAASLEGVARRDFTGAWEAAVQEAGLLDELGPRNTRRNAR